MQPKTATTANKLHIGDRFYKATDSKKTVLQMVPGETKKTHYRTYKYWCQADNERYPQAITGTTQVIFLRHTQPVPEIKPPLGTIINPEALEAIKASWHSESQQ